MRRWPSTLGDAWGHSYVGGLLLEPGEPLEAKRAFERAVSAAPRRGFFWGQLGSAHEAVDELFEAEQCYRKGLSLELDGSYLCRRYGLLLKRVGKLQKAKRYVTRAIALDPDDTRARDALAELVTRQA